MPIAKRVPNADSYQRGHFSILISLHCPHEETIRSLLPKGKTKMTLVLLCIHYFSLLVCHALGQLLK